MDNPTGKICVRQADAADIPRLSDLLGLLFAQEADFQPDAEKQSRGLALIIGQPETGRIYCAMDGETIVGMVSLLYTVSTAEGGRAAWLEDMIVHPDRRAQGIGDQLLRAAVNGARSTGCLRLTLLTDATNLGAQRFYARAGFMQSQMVPLRLNL
jgi:GNAT superfamily N-acetyltransferase